MGIEMNFGGVALDSVEENGVDKFDDGSFVGQSFRVVFEHVVQHGFEAIVVVEVVSHGCHLCLAAYRYRHGSGFNTARNSG